jgi:hypothetical protein
MRNIHLLLTDKPSRLAGSEYITNEQGIDKRVLKFKLWDKLIPNKDLKDIGYIPQNIYITSDEEIKKGDWFYCFQNNNFLKCFKKENSLLNGYHTKYSKIILTTDPDLIEDGIQPIDDKFLEWFVKNPSCEEVDVIYDKDTFPYGVETAKGYGWYKIIPQEEPKITNCGNKNCQSGVINGINPRICKKCNPQEEPKQEFLEKISSIDLSPEFQQLISDNWEDLTSYEPKQESLEEAAEMSNKQQTAVEWLSKKTFIPVYLLEQAKEMEKERLKRAYDWGETNASDECNGDGATHENFEQYFEETYKSE